MMCVSLFSKCSIFQNNAINVSKKKSFINALVSQPSGTNPYAMWGKVSAGVYNSGTICGKEVQGGEMKM